MAEDPTGVQAARRAAKFPGPRCYSHHGIRKREIRLANHGRRTHSNFGLSPENYRRLFAFQGGACIGCGRAKGNLNGDRGKKNLAVDHDHTCCSGPTSCGRCVRMLLCGPCNDVLAHFRDDPAALRRLADALENWPSRQAGVVPLASRAV
jgi:hypothetical protein